MKQIDPGMYCCGALLAPEQAQSNSYGETTFFMCTLLYFLNVLAQICSICGEDLWMQQRGSDFLKLLKPLRAKVSK